MTEPTPAAPKKSRKARWIFWGIVAFVVLVPIPRKDGPWLPLLFVFFEWLNGQLPENF